MFTTIAASGSTLKCQWICRQLKGDHQVVFIQKEVASSQAQWLQEAAGRKWSLLWLQWHRLQLLTVIYSSTAAAVATVDACSAIVKAFLTQTGDTSVLKYIAVLFFMSLSPESQQKCRKMEMAISGYLVSNTFIPVLLEQVQHSGFCS